MRLIGAAAIALVLTLTFTSASAREESHRRFDGREIFRYDTFGDEQLWTSVLRLHEAVQTLSPETALSVGLKVDARALPRSIVEELKADTLDLKNPAVTIELLRLNAVVGVMGKVESGKLTSIGITCALCHSNVDNSLTTGIGRRLDGWANHDLNVGAIVGLAPGLDPALKTEFSMWGPGMYDPRHHAFDGMNLIGLNSPSVPVVMPPIYGLRGVGFETYTGDGPISVLEQLRGRLSDGRPGKLPRSPHWSLHQAETGSRDAETAGPARLPTTLAGARTTGGQLQHAGRRARQARVLPGGGMWQLSYRADLHRCAERSASRPAGLARSGGSGNGPHLCKSKRHGQVSNDTVAGTLAARAVLP